MRPLRSPFALVIVLVALPSCRVPDKYLSTGDDGDPTESGVDARPSGDIVWARSLSALLPTAVIAGSGGIVVTGYIYATVDLGGSLLTAIGQADMVVASFSEADATHLYSVRHGDAGSEFAFMNLTDTTGAPYIYGVSYGDSDLGQGIVTGGGGPGSDGYIGRYTAGNPGWIQRIVGPGEDKILASAFAPSGAIIGAGWFEGSAVFNGATLTTAGGRDIFFARYNTFSGAVDLTKQYGGTGRDEISGAASTSGSSNFVLSGFFDDTIDFGGGISITASGGGLDAWIAKMNANGTAAWAVRFGGAGDDRDPNVAVDSAGDVYVVGSFTTQMVMGAFTLDAVGGANTDAFVAKLSGADGSVIWATSIGTAGAEVGGRLAIDDRGHLAHCMYLSGALSGEPTNGGRDALISVRNTDDGSIKWQHVYSTTGDDGAGPVGFARSGDVLATVNLGASYDFGVPVTGAASPTSVLLRLAL